MARIVILVNFILFSLSGMAASESLDVDISSSSNAEISISSNSSSDSGSSSSSGSESYLASSTVGSSKSSVSKVLSPTKKPLANCPKGKKKSSCPKHEVSIKCMHSYCKPQKCSEKGRAIPCPAIAGPCEKGCVCKSGYLRNSRGRCIPENKCPTVCSANEEFSNCTQAVCRQQTCKDKETPLSCPAIAEGDCNSGCVCQSGYLRTPEGECVPQYQCSGDLVCKTDEVVANCPNSGHGDYCPKSEKEAKSRKQSKVIAECEEQSCTCGFNYMRADNGTCIPARDCPPFNCTGENEEFDPCPPLCPTDDCAQATPSGRCPLLGRIGIVLHCRADCRCKSGYWRKNGVCVPYSECPGICSVNEEFSDCIQGVCRAQNCAQKGKPIACAEIAEGSCEKGCICSSGFLRDELGNCVPDDQCPAPKCDGQNEVLADCANACDPINCPESLQAEKERLADCVSIAACLPPDCRCRPDYRRDDNGTCIPIGECPGICQANEEFSNCTKALCRAQNCTEREKPIACPGIEKDSCEKGCVCSTGFLRNAEGNCVPEDQCPAEKCPTNERYSTCIQGECRALNCTQKGKAIACPRLASGACRTGCVCVEGTLRAENGSCIPEKECPVCSANEEFSNCTQAVCRQQTCKDKEMPLSCPAIEEGYCISGCVCQPGYLRTPEGECVPQNQCSGDLVCKTDEVVANCPNSGHGDYCPKSENDAKSRKQLKVISDCEEQSCTCRFNYMRADNGTCIPARDCPPFNCTGENEEFDPCPPLCPTDDCAQATPSGRCPLLGRIGIVLHCRADCRCKSGYWRKNGVCVPYSECPGICSVNEEFSDCIQGVCRAQNCAQKGKAIACAEIAEGSCEKGCICSSGFLRDELGNCVPDDQCLASKCDGQNEVLADCANACDPINCPESLQVEKERLADCVSIAACLMPDCRCRPDYRRDDNGTCIPIGECPGICQANEEFSNCTKALCRAQNCTEREKPIACPGIEEDSCEKGCVCSTGFLRNAEGNCVPEDQCPAEKCPTNERYSTCIQGECRALNCTQKGKAIACPRLASGACRTGCVCVEGTLRAENGSCIPEKECPVCSANEEFSNCTQAVCRQQTCKDKEMPLSCPAIEEGYCISGCVCQPGYLRTPEGECVPQNQCSGDLVCKTDEVVANCPNSGHGDYCPKSENDAKSRKQLKVISDCEEQSCTCRFNYMRADNGTCIPARDCPPFDCTGENEEFVPCPPLCPTDDCAQATPSGRCPLLGRIGIVLHCRADCRCKSGYWRKNGVCVPYSECPGICSVNEEFSDCIQGVCRAQNCAQKGKAIACAEIAEGSCEKGCICSSGFLRDELGNCIPDDQCQVNSNKNITIPSVQSSECK